MRLLALLLLASTVSREIAGQQIDTTVPKPVVRRLAQAIWPRNLFDSNGRPEGEFRRTGFEPHYTELRVFPTKQRVARLPAVEFYLGGGTNNDCHHCGYIWRAVARRGDEYITLLGLEDIQSLIDWAQPSFADGDSLAIQLFVLESVRATFLSEAVVIRSKSSIESSDSPFLKGSSSPQGAWTFPETRTWRTPGQMKMEFVLYRPHVGVYAVRVEQQHDGRFLRIQIEEVAGVRMF